jgi:hypothetical protein
MFDQILLYLMLLELPFHSYYLMLMLLHQVEESLVIELVLEQ